MGVTIGHLETLMKAIRTDGATPVLLVMSGIHMRGEPPVEWLLALKALKTVADRHDAGFVDLGRHFGSLSEEDIDRSWFRGNQHWRPSGHRRAAQEIVDQLARLRLLSPIE